MKKQQIFSHCKEEVEDICTRMTRKIIIELDISNRQVIRLYSYVRFIFFCIFKFLYSVYMYNVLLILNENDYYR